MKNMKPIGNNNPVQIDQSCCNQPLTSLSEAQQSCCCPSSEEQNKPDPPFYTRLPLKNPQDSEPMLEACCGAPPGPAANSWEQPGYKLYSFVSGFVFTPRGWIPQIATKPTASDIFMAILIRLGYRGGQQTCLTPGLYCVGDPDQESPVLVTANYRLSLDVLRRELKDVNAWILVLDTRGINVWCAAGKKLFSTQEAVRMVKSTGLDQIVKHRELILPQLGATGVSAQKVKKECGFSVTWGPIRAKDIPQFLKHGKADTAMRRATFTLKERAELIPVEFTNSFKKGLLIIAFFFLLSGIGPDIFSLSAMWSKGIMSMQSILAGAFGGFVALPLLLPWLPGRAFAQKAVFPGLVLGFALLIISWGSFNILQGISLLLLATSISSFTGMHFTGSTPYTSPSGVEKEMKIALPLQGAALVLTIIFWLWASFI